ncbi:hypothetical protein IPH25_01375 [bacterium]|nr:MAG: hypothetical protein IPG37_03500 [bacterium]QQR62078.1 MAG: hypothetical protein IPH25_01375 [bacterium]QQR63367.1 MAG: hypothetical protein IPH67_02755 [bacterium]
MATVQTSTRSLFLFIALILIGSLILPLVHIYFQKFSGAEIFNEAGLYLQVRTAFFSNDFQRLRALLNGVVFERQLCMIDKLSKELPVIQHDNFDSLLLQLIFGTDSCDEQETLFAYMFSKDTVFIKAKAFELSAFNVLVRCLSQAALHTTFLSAAKKAYEYALKNNDPVFFAALMEYNVPIEQPDAVNYLTCVLEQQKHEAFVQLLLRAGVDDNLLIKYHASHQLVASFDKLFGPHKTLKPKVDVVI